MTSPALELQQAVFAALSGDAALVAMLGSERIHDHAPASVAFPYITFGRSAVEDWSTTTEDGSEHLFSLHVWSKADGKKQALEIMELTCAALHDASLVLASHRLVNLRAEGAEVRFNDDHAVYHGVVRFRAITENGQ